MHHLDAPNPWFSTSFLQQNKEFLWSATREHILLVVLSVAIGLLLSLPLSVLVKGHRRLSTVLLQSTGVLYTIPSLALFAVLEPLTGLTLTTALIGLTSYTLLILVRNVLAGFEGVPEEVLESARGMGLGRWQTLARVELPLALPTILAGVRVAAVSNVALATVGVVVSHGGLGQVIFQGLYANFYRAEVLAGTLLCVLLAGVAEVLLLGLERAVTPWTRR